ncbi:MAG: hypothetical protein KIS96_14600, partial [Bauldia sp.]|nr:hypothetical protein [Bauldia sp.]
MSIAGLAFADGMDGGRYGNERQLVEGVLARLKSEARAVGWKGQFLVDVIRTARDAGTIISIQIGPGHGDITVDQVRAFL